MEASALRYSGGLGLQARTPLLRLQSDDKLIAYTRRGNQAAFEVLVSRYQSRLLAFCRHLLGSKEDAEDVLQEVLAAAFNALLADDRPINVRPWLYRIARNRSLNHLRRTQPVGVDSMDVHFSEHGATTADKVAQREQFRLLVGDIQDLPETQRTALILREMEALSYDQISEAMETTVPGVKSLLVRARISLAEAAEARQLSCSEVRIELGEVAEGLRRKPSPLVRRHLKGCNRCTSFDGQLKTTSKALGILLPIGPLALLKRLLVAHIGHSAGGGSGATAAGATAGGTSAAGAGAVGAAGVPVAAGAAGSTGVLSAGATALATKAAAGLAAAFVVTGGAVEVDHLVVHHRPVTHNIASVATVYRHHVADVAPATSVAVPAPAKHVRHKKPATAGKAKSAKKLAATAVPGKAKPVLTALAPKHGIGTAALVGHHPKHHKKPGRTDKSTSTTVLKPGRSGGSHHGSTGTGSSAQQSTTGGTQSGTSTSATSTSNGSHTTATAASGSQTETMAPSPTAG